MLNLCGKGCFCVGVRSPWMSDDAQCDSMKVISKSFLGCNWIKMLGN